MAIDLRGFKASFFKAVLGRDFWQTRRWGSAVVGRKGSKSRGKDDGTNGESLGCEHMQTLPRNALLPGEAEVNTLRVREKGPRREKLAGGSARRRYGRA